MRTESLRSPRDVSANASEPVKMSRTPGLLDEISQASIEADVQHLSSYSTRRSNTADFAAAAAWAEARFVSMGYSSRLQTVPLAGGSTANVIANSPRCGTHAGPLILVVAHLDSYNASGAALPAPGADDNASGCAAVLELARIFQGKAPPGLLRFVLFGGEEQGMAGSSHYLGSLLPGEKTRIKAVLNLDMIARRNTASPSVLFEGGAPSQTLIDRLHTIADGLGELSVTTSLSPYGSDHVPFINAGLPAVLVIEGEDGNNPDDHTANDLPARLDYDLALRILRVVTAHLAGEAGLGGETAMADIEMKAPPQPGQLDFTAQLESFYQAWKILPYSGKYTYGSPPKDARRAPEPGPAERLEQPVFLEAEGLLPVYQPPLTLELMKFGIVLHIDIDGKDPLNVVSGDIFSAFGSRHFIGRVASDAYAAGVHSLIVDGFSFTWPGRFFGAPAIIEKLEVKVSKTSVLAPPAAEVKFCDAAGAVKAGPYALDYVSRYFRQVEMDVDKEDHATSPEPFNTFTHPDRPADLVNEDLTLESAYAKAGILVTRGAANIVSTAEAPGGTWSEAELHDSMELHWEAFANKPQWKMWVYLAERAEDPGLGGVMFDGYIDEPGGVDRQGTAVFTECAWFHKPTGGYTMANPPADKAAVRELFFDYMHESAHCFNLFHSFQKTLDSPWVEPSWFPKDPLRSRSASWINYPDVGSGSGTSNATAFYNRFYFRFDKQDLLFLRHAPRLYVEPGGSAWGMNHGRVTQTSLDRRLELKVRQPREVIGIGEPVFVELKLKNISDEPVTVNANLDPEDDLVGIGITGPDGSKIPFVPIACRRSAPSLRTLQPGESVYCPVNITMGRLGFAFKNPGAYRVEASYRNIDGRTAAAVMQLYLKPPASYDEYPAIHELFHARVGRALYFGGSRVMGDVNERLDWVRNRLGPRHPIGLYLACGRYLPLGTASKIVKPRATAITVLEREPDRVVEHLEPVMQAADSVPDIVTNIPFRSIVDRYTAAAMATRDARRAAEAQERMLGLFQARKVLPSVTAEIERRIGDIKRGAPLAAAAAR